MPELPWDALPWRIERRASPSAVMRIAAPLIAAAAMLATSFLIFAFLGKDPLNALEVFFIEPLNSLYGWGELVLKATPLALCGLGLALGFSANVWNIGAEGQLTLGAICGGGVALYWGNLLGPLALPASLLAGIAGGAAWAAIPAYLRTRFNTSEILVSLMLVYIAQLLLTYLLHGVWRDPEGFNFPQSRAFDERILLPLLYDGQRANLAFPMMLALAAASWVFSSRLFAGYYLGHLSADLAHPAPVLSGACLWVSRSVLEEVGSFDEQFFLYAEDIDLSYRIEQAGYTNYYYPGTTIVHFKGESTTKDIGYVRQFYRAMSQFRRKHFGRGMPAFFSWAKILERLPGVPVSTRVRPGTRPSAGSG